MDVFIPAPGSSLPGAILPDPSITPVNADGTINHADIAANLAYIHIYPYAGIQLGDEITCVQEILGGTWFSFREVTDPSVSVNVRVRPVDVEGGSYTIVSYTVKRADGTPLGHSAKRHYDVV
ncbi:hypothetical protein [Pseudomonas azotoformans]|uniref:hypothetical protein n=1 Tax=Pseudomonas azotoformans TaxID=47878 RepID=UPI00106D1611|nr:hypothetical protein [Pseudomonas azotoformans]